MSKKYDSWLIYSYTAASRPAWKTRLKPLVGTRVTYFSMIFNPLKVLSFWVVGYSVTLS